MKRLAHVFFWFTGLAVIVKLLLFRGQPLGYFWLIIVILSIFFGFQFKKHLKIPDGESKQVISWLTNYQNCSVSKQKIYLNEVITEAVKFDRIPEAVRFLNYILETEPDNEIARGLLISLLSTEVFENNHDKKGE